MPDDQLLRRTLAVLSEHLDDFPVYIRGSAGLRLLLPGFAGRAVRDVDLICASTSAADIVGRLMDLSGHTEPVVKELTTEGTLVGQDYRYEWSGAALLPVDLVVASTPKAPMYFERLGVRLPGETLRVLDLAMLVVDKAKLLCPNAAHYASNRAKDLHDLAAIAAIKLPDSSKLEIAVAACGELWNWRDWSGFPAIPVSWAEDVGDVVLPYGLLALVAEAARKAGTDG